MNKIIDQIINTIKKNQNFLIVAHDNLDGDSIGSELALALAIKSLNKKVQILLNEPIPAQYRFLPGLPKLIVSTKELDKPNSVKDKKIPDVLFVLDTAGWNQIKKIKPVQFNKQTIINIDHHIDNKRFGDINWVDPKASAVGEQIYGLLKRLPVILTKDIAKCLYTAIITDTGSFQYANTTAATHKIISHLLTLGIYPHLISGQIYENISLSRLRLLQLALKRLESTGKDNQIIYTWITRKMLKKAHAKQEDTGGFIDYLKAAKGIKIAIVFKENTKPGEIRVNFRSKDQKIFVNEIAHQFGGGGHPAAAGCTVYGSGKEVKKKVLNAAKTTLKMTNNTAKQSFRKAQITK